MEAQQLSVKVFVDGNPDFDLSTLIPIFHRWIREGTLGDELLIDVADYGHVPNGPGVLIIGHEGHYIMDLEDGELGLQYNRKRDQPGEAQDKIVEALGRCLRACQALETEASVKDTLRFQADRIRIQVANRLLAPNTKETHAAYQSVFDRLIARLYDAKPATVTPPSDPRSLYGVHIQADQPLDVQTALQRLA
jgi:hypothetical protein